VDVQEIVGEWFCKEVVFPLLAVCRQWLSSGHVSRYIIPDLWADNWESPVSVVFSLISMMVDWWYVCQFLCDLSMMVVCLLQLMFRKYLVHVSYCSGRLVKYDFSVSAATCTALCVLLLCQLQFSRPECHSECLLIVMLYVTFLSTPTRTLSKLNTTFLLMRNFSTGN